MLSWFPGVVFLACGVGLFASYPLAALCFGGISALFLPPVRQLTFTRTGMRLHPLARAIGVLFLLVCGAGFAASKDSKEAAALLEIETRERVQKEQHLRDFFNTHRDSILTEITTAIAGAKYEAALTITTEYRATNDTELSELEVQIQEGIKKKEADGILAQLKTIPSREYEENLVLYRRLVSLFPDSDVFSQKANHYAAKVEEEEQRVIERQRAEWKKALLEKNRVGDAVEPSHRLQGEIRVSRSVDEMYGSPNQARELLSLAEAHPTKKIVAISWTHHGIARVIAWNRKSQTVVRGDEMGTETFLRATKRNLERVARDECSFHFR